LWTALSLHSLVNCHLIVSDRIDAWPWIILDEFDNAIWLENSNEKVNLGRLCGYCFLLTTGGPQESPCSFQPYRISLLPG
jgi:hypothetical protein